MYDENLIAKHIYESDLCVSPGNVGLTCIHSLTYGTPVSTHNNFKNQMPEAEAIQDGKNGFFFKENNIEDLQVQIIKWFELYHDKTTKDSVREIIDLKYNPYFQLNVITKMIKSA